ncbi:MAG: hypothetical protein ACO2OZ_07615, partial [Acidilobaceae archaeon]
TMVYEEEMKRQPIPEGIKDTIDYLLKIINSYREGLRILIVLPEDIYDGLGEDIRNVLNQYKLKLDLRDAVFLAEVVKEYSEVCRDKLDEDKLSDLVNEIARFNEGHALIARLAGTLLAEKFKCNIDDARRVVDESKREATAFIEGFINSYFEINDDVDRARVLAEVFAIRKPFADPAEPGVPILTPGIVNIIKSVVNPSLTMTDEKAYWLSIRHHDLIEHTIENLLSKKNLRRASEVWAITKIPRIEGAEEALEYFINNNDYRGKFIEKLDEFSWKRLALVTGLVLTGFTILPSKEDLSRVLDEYLNKSENLKESLEEALSSGVIDRYLVVDNKIPIFVNYLVLFHLFSEKFNDFWKKFVNREDLIKSIVSDAKKLLEVWSGRKGAFPLEALYALGLAVITSKAIELGKEISEEEASTILKAALSGVASSLHPFYVNRILILLRRLGFKAPQYYTSLLSILSGSASLDKDEFFSIFDTLNSILSNPEYFNKFTELVWPLVYIVKVYSDLLYNHAEYIDLDKIEDFLKRVCTLLNVLRGKSPELATIAEAYVLLPPLRLRGVVEGYVKQYCSINDIIAEADVVLNNLEKMAGDASKLVGNKTFMEWIKTITLNPSEEDVRKVISRIEHYFTSRLAEYKLNVDRLDEARKLYDKAAGIAKSIGHITYYLSYRGWILRVDVIKARNLNEYTNVAKGFEDLWNKALKNLEPSPYYYLESNLYSLGNYLVYLASIGRHGDVEGLLNKYAYLLN